MPAMNMTTATAMPIYPSASNPVNLKTSIATSTAAVAIASESESAAVAFMTDEPILSASLLLNRQSHSFTSTEIPKTIIMSQENSVVISGSSIFSTESERIFQPTSIMKNDTIILATYSILACPNGWSRSAGFAAILKLMNEIICEPASDRLLIPSAIRDIAPNIIPTTYLPIAKMTLNIIPTTLPSVPYARLTSGDLTLFLSFTNSFNKSSVKKNTSQNFSAILFFTLCTAKHITRAMREYHCPWQYHLRYAQISPR